MWFKVNKKNNSPSVFWGGDKFYTFKSNSYKLSCQVKSDLQPILHKKYKNTIGISLILGVKKPYF